MVCIRDSPSRVSTERSFPRIPHPIRDHFHGFVEIDFLPDFRVRCAVFYFLQASGMGVQFVGISALGTKVSTRNWGLRIAFDGNQLPVFVIHQLPATDSAVRTNRARHLGPISFWSQIVRALTHGFGTSSTSARSNLFDQWPLSEEIF